MVTHTGEWEIDAISGRLPDNPGELACMLLYFGFSQSLSQFQPIFLSFVTISAALCCCFKAISLIGILL